MFTAQASDTIDLKQTVVTFTNLHNEVFTNVSLSSANLDGVTYFYEGGGGFVSYTNLPPGLLVQWGIPTNRIDIAIQRAADKAEQDKKYWDAYNAQAQVAAAQAAKQRADYLAQQQAAAAAQAQDNSQTNSTSSTSGKKSGGKKHKNSNANGN